MTTCWCAVEYSLCVLPSDYCKFFANTRSVFRPRNASTRRIKSRGETTRRFEYPFFSLFHDQVRVLVAKDRNLIPGTLEWKRRIEKVPRRSTVEWTDRSFSSLAASFPPFSRRPLQVSSRHEVATLRDFESEPTLAHEPATTPLWSPLARNKAPVVTGPPSLDPETSLLIPADWRRERFDLLEKESRIDFTREMNFDSSFSNYRQCNF